MHHQVKVLKETKKQNKVAYYLDMGLGKTFVGSEKLRQLGEKLNLIVCQKSKVNDWIRHFDEYYDDFLVYDGTKEKCFQLCLGYTGDEKRILVINYELIFRRKLLSKWKEFTLMLDESSMIQNENAKRSRFILNLRAKNVILLSGTPTAGKYEKLWSQCRLLGWSISKSTYWSQYIDFEIWDKNGFPLKIVRGYKNVERLKEKLREHGAIFMKSKDVFDLPEQIFTPVNISTTSEYKRFRKNSIVEVDGIELVGDTPLTKMLYERQLCGVFNSAKVQAFSDLLLSSDDRMIVFYNFTEEYNILKEVVKQAGRSFSVVNGQKKDLDAYENVDNSITFIQYQAGAMGLNLQKANTVVYFTPPLSSELFEQSKKRVHRIGQENRCFYYQLICTNSVEEKIYKTLAMRKDFTERLFEEV